jgi:hypothetical protein
MGAGLSDMETLRSLEQAVHRNVGLQGGSRREQGEAPSSQLDKGGEALLRMLSGGASGQVDPEAMARLRRGILLSCVGSWAGFLGSFKCLHVVACVAC